MSDTAGTAGLSRSGEGAVGSDLGSLLSQYGITGGAGGYVDPSDPPVLRPGARLDPALGRGRKPNARVPRSTAVNEFYGWSTSQLKAFQEKAFSAGLYGTADRADIRWGDYDSDTFSIWQEMVDRAAGALANDRQLTPEQALDMAAKAGAPGNLGRGASRPALVVSVANPDDLRSIFDSVAQSLIGRRLDDDQLDRLVTSYQAVSRQEQEQRYALGAEGSAGGSVTDAPDPRSFAEQEITEENPEMVAGEDIANRMNEFFQGLRGVV